MGKDTADQRPLSPPHSNDGDFGIVTNRIERLQEPFTPPRTVRPASRAEIAYSAYRSPGQYPPLPAQGYYTSQPAFVKQLHYHTPPSAVDSGMMTRSGRALGSPIEPKYPHNQSPKPKKNRNNRAGKKGLPVIDQPLSVLTQDYQIPIRDMGAWVNRSIEDRMRDVEKKKGYVSRPMNSFMLYRSAYADRVKQFCKENNHQVVSQVTGQSWPLEPSHIREMYEQYAITERDNHAAAHPTYKFAPNKSGKKRGRDDDDNDSDSDDDWKGPGSHKRSRPSTRDVSRSASSTPFEPDRSARFGVPMYHQPPHMHPSSYQAMNPHGPPPFNFGPGGYSNGYYQPHAIPYGHHVDDVKFGRVEDPFTSFDTGSQLIGMPDSSGSELLGTHDTSGGFAMEQMLDPRLAQFDPSYMYGIYDGGPEQAGQQPHGYGYDGYQIQGDASHPIEQYHPGMATLTEGWPEDGQVGSDFDSELQKWS